MIGSWIKRGLNWLVFAAAGLLTVLVLAAGAFWWWAGTEGSLAWTLQQLGRWQPVQAEGVRGSLRSGLFVDRLRWEQEGLTIEAREVRLEWKPLALLTGELHLDELGARSVRIEDRRPPKPGAAPTSLALPVHPVIDDLRIGSIEWVTPANSVVLSDLIAHYRFTGQQHQLQLDRLRWQSGAYRGRASVGADGALHVNALLEGRFPAALPGSADPLPLDFSVTLLGPLADLQAQGRLQVGTGSPAAGTRATATARLTPWAEQPVPQAQADLQELDLGAFWGQAPHTSLSGQVRVQPAGPDAWSLSADLTNSMPGPWDRDRLPLDELSAQGEWRGSGELLVRRLQAQVGGGAVRASGQWRDAGGWTMAGELAGVNPAAVYSAMAAVPLSGSADATGEGDAIAFEVDLRARAARERAAKPAPGSLAATLGALELRQAAARGRWNDGLLSLPQLEVQTADAILRAAVEVRPQTLAGSGQATLRAPGLQASIDGRVAERDGGGSLRLASSDLAAALAWLKRLPGIPAGLRDVSAAGRGEVRLAWQGGWRDPTVEASAALPLVQVQEPGSAAEPAWAIRDTAATVRGRLSDAQVIARGRAEQGQRRVRFELGGKLGRLAQASAGWRGEVGTLNLAATDPALGPGPWTLRLQQGFGFRWAGGRFDAGAGEALLGAPPRPSDRTRAALGPTVLAWGPVRWGGGELRTAGRLTGLPLAWLELVGGPQLMGSAVSGDMIFDGQWDATLGAKPRIEASLVRSSGDVSLLAETVQGASTRIRAGVREARLSLLAEGETATLTLRWDSERGGTAQGRVTTRLAQGGAAGWHWPDSAPLSGQLEARLPRIGVWSLLAPPGWRLRGSVLADLAIAGTKADPQLTGTLSADDLALRSVVDGIQLQGGYFRARLEGQRLVITEFVLHGAGEGAAGGTLRATGAVTWAGKELDARMTAQLSRLRASIRSDHQLTVSGQLVARLDGSGTEVTGQLTVDRALIVLPDESTPRLGDDVVVLNAAGPIGDAAPAARQDGTTPVRPIEVAVKIDLGDEFRVRGQGISTRLQGELLLTAQSISQPRLTGTIRTVGGEYRAYGQRLNIERGVIRFTGPIDNPALDILAVRPNMLQRVGVQVTGRAMAPYVRLYAQPDLPEAEKLSWLITGRSAPSGGAEAALVQQAALALLACRSGTGKGGIAGALGLDDLSFKRDGANGPSLTLGKRFGQNFYAAYERGLSGALGTLFIFYDLTRRLTLRAEAGERTALDLIFTLAYD